MAARKRSGRKKNPAQSKKRERKDRLVQTRITPSLYEQVVKRAEALRIPVSNLIRIVLEESDKLVGGVVDQSLSIAEVFRQGSSRSQAAPAEEAPVAWQPVIMGRRALCGQCNQVLYPSEPAHMGLGTDGRPLLFVCPACFDRLTKKP